MAAGRAGGRAAGRAVGLVVAGRARADRAVVADPAGAVPAAADEGLGEMRPAAGDRVEGHPTGKAARALDSAVETVPSATSMIGTGIAAGEAHPAALTGRGSAPIGRAPA
ncbi:MAG: hypothetical protein WEF51_01580, partial [Chloroflexota bacterium]